MSTQFSRLDAETDLSTSTGPIRTKSTDKGGTESKIHFCAKIADGVCGYATEQVSEAGRL